MARIDTLTHFLTDIADAIRAKKGSSELIGAANFDTEIESIPSGGNIDAPMKDVNLYDYDGTRLYSYTKTEFLQLSALPENPTHEGLIAQGWNWTLSDAKSYVTDNSLLEIGQIYNTVNNATRVHVNLEKGPLSPYIGFATAGTSTIDWGDGTSIDTVTGVDNSINGLQFINHTYAQPGKYVITITPIDIGGYPYFYGYDYGSYLVSNGALNDGTGNNRAYNYSVEKIEFGKCAIGDKAFRYCQNLKYISLPSDIRSIGAYTFYYTSIQHINFPSGYYSLAAYAIYDFLTLKGLSFPKSLTGFSRYSLYNLYNVRRINLPVTSNTKYTSYIFQANGLDKIVVPEGITQIATLCFSGCYFATEIILPSTLTNISSSNVFTGYHFELIDCRKFTSIPTCGSNTFGTLPTNTKIVVPDNLYETIIATSGWSDYSSHIIKASQYNG